MRSRAPGHVSMVWPTVLIVLTVAFATMATVVVARGRSNGVHATAESSFDASGERMATAVGIALQRTTDIADNAGTFVKVTPSLTQDGFQAWFDSGGLNTRPGLLGLGYIERVPLAALPAYSAARAHDPTGPSVATDFTLTPVGDRPDYCFVRIEDSGAAAAIGHLPPGFDICATGTIKDLLLSATNSGRPQVLAIGASNSQSTTDPYLSDGLRAIGGTAFAIFEPVYDGVPGDAAARLASIKGWIVGAFDGPTLVRTALGRDYHSVGLRLSWSGSGAESVIAESPLATAPDNSSLEFSKALADQWHLRLSAPDAAVAASARWTGVITAAVGGLLTLLLAALMLVFSRSRNRALRLVEQKTRELRQQTLHDSLTGLPNRVLALDRATQLLAAAWRDGRSAAALFLDLDGFKEVNDVFGHHVGDNLLRAVASRLRLVLRESETIARLGGDEFVVLADCAAPEVLAKRLLAAMTQPFDLEEGPSSPITIGVSIGVATGRGCDADELLRRADVAMYKAKASGRGTYAVFEATMQTALDASLSSELVPTA